MKICLLGQFPPHVGGVSSHLWLLSKQFINHGDQVWVLTYNHRSHFPDNGARIETAWAPKIKGLRGLFFTIFALLKLFVMARKYEFDIIHAHYALPPGLIAVIIGKLTGTRTAVTVHGSDVMILCKNYFMRSLTKWTLNHSDYVMAVSESLKSRITDLAIPPSRVHLTPTSIDSSYFSSDKPLPSDLQMDPKKFNLLFVGNLVPQKGLIYLLEAKKILDNLPNSDIESKDFELFIVGKGPLMKQLKHKVISEDIRNVRFLGERRDVAYIMPSADLFVLSSISEGFPVTILEALASGLPVVATRVGGIEEIADSSVIRLADPYSPESLAEAIYDMRSAKSSDCALRARLISNKYSQIKIPYCMC